MNNNFYLEIYNKIIEFNDKKITIIFDTDGNPWFIYRNILEILEYSNIKDAIKDTNIDDEYIIAYKDLNTMGVNDPPIVSD